MKKQWLLNLFLLLIALALGTLIYFGDMDGHSRSNRHELAHLTDIDGSSVKQIQIDHNGHQTKLIKNDKGWKLLQPIEIGANNFRIKTILQLLNAPVHSRYHLNELDTKQAGLESSNTRVRFDNTEIIFGIINPGTNLRYIQIGDSVYTIEDVYYPLLSAGFTALVSLRLLPADAVIRKLELPAQSIEQDASGRWQATPALDGDLVMQTLDSWRSAEAFGIHAYMQRKSLGEISVYFSNHAPIHFTVTDTDPWLIMARKDLGIEYHLDIETYNKLVMPQTPPPAGVTPEETGIAKPGI